MHNNGAFTILVDESNSGKRLDTVVASHISDCSRSIAASLIRNEKILVQGAVKKPGYRVGKGDEICGLIPPKKPISLEPEPIRIDILYEDEYLIVVNKPSELVVHPAPGHYTGTLVNALLYHCHGLEGIGEKLRPGIVHRLDKDTSGTLVVAKKLDAFDKLSMQFKNKTVKKDYLVLVQGEMEAESGTITFPIGRHFVDRKRMSTISRKGRIAETMWKVRERFQGATLLDVDLKTGRTHQIRVHFASIDHPVIGDPVYSGQKAGKYFSKGSDKSAPKISVPRQMLHAWRLSFTHPVSEKVVSFESPVPQDMAELITILRKTAKNS